MGRILFGLILFAVILGIGVVLTVKPGSDAAYEAAQTRIAVAIEEDQRILKLGDLSNLGTLPPELGEMDRLVQLDLRGTVISDISVLAGLEKLQILSLRETLVMDISALEGLASLGTLDLGKSWVRDLGPLGRMTGLKRLDIGDTWTDSLEPLVRAPALEWINLHGAHATDGSRAGYDAMHARGITVNNGRAFREDYRPGFVQRLRVTANLLIRRAQLGLGALD